MHQVVPVNYILLFITKKLNLIIIIIIIRLWKARASEKLGIMRDRERVALQYNEKLKEKYGQHPLVSRIARHRQVPKHVKFAAAEIRSIKVNIFFSFGFIFIKNVTHLYDTLSGIKQKEGG